jgi:hypothetical protein
MRLTENNKLKSLLHSHGYDIMSVTWEDTARTKGSCWGHNISDMTLNIPSLGRMPVIRKPNFADLTFDLPIEQLTCPINNENMTAFQTNNNELETISLRHYLENIGQYTSDQIPSMYLPRDEKILVSTQYCLLPCKTNKVEFNVNLYNYQANVLTVVVTSQGTSCQLISDGGNILYFNKFGQNANLLVERLKVDRLRRGVALEGKMTKEEKQRNVVFIYQIPLKPEPLQSRNYFKFSSFGGSTFGGSGSMNCSGTLAGSEPNPFNLSGEELFGDDGELFCGDELFGGDDDSDESDNRDHVETPRKDNLFKGFDEGILSTSDGFGTYKGANTKRKLERDDRYPIRLTIQHYKVMDLEITDIPAEVVLDMVQTLDNLYKKGDAISSLVLQDTNRSTEPINHLVVPTIKPTSIFNF